MREVELNSLISYLESLTDDEFNDIFTKSSDVVKDPKETQSVTEVVKLNIIKLIKYYYGIDLNKKYKKYQRNVKKDSIDQDLLNHFLEVVNDLINYLRDENINIVCLCLNPLVLGAVSPVTLKGS